MIFIDANVLLAYFNEDDLHHGKAFNLWQKIKSGVFGPWFISDYIFNEVVGVSLRKFGKEKTLFAGNQLLKNMVIVNIDDHILNEAWKIFSNTSLKLSLVDCTNLVIMKLANTNQIVTFDKEFKNVKNLKVTDS